MKKIIVFMPAYNAEKTIVKVLQRFSRPLINRISEILVLDNCSKDRTYDMVMDYKRKKKLSKLIILKKDETDTYPFSFGKKKAKMIVENFEEIKKFAEEV